MVEERRVVQIFPTHAAAGLVLTRRSQWQTWRTRHPPDNPLYRGKRLVGQYLTSTCAHGVFQTAPFLIRTFVKVGTFHRLSLFEDGTLPTTDEQQIFTWYVDWVHSSNDYLYFTQERRDLARGLDNPTQRCTSDPRTQASTRQMLIPRHLCRRRK